ncbi:PAS-domain containing protein [Caenispirillum salinarum]|uniref:PAS-domain containing protein n=1 Tax=Caenispirillum salinarum TaxID=859058 RepID=UPI00384EFA1D
MRDTDPMAAPAGVPGLDLRARGLLAPALILAAACAAASTSAVAGLAWPAVAGPAAAAVGAVLALVRRARKAERALAAAAAEIGAARVRVEQSADLQAHMLDAVESVSEGFVLFGQDGRLIHCNERYRSAYPMLADILEPGITFDALLREAARRGARDPDDDGPLETWVERRLRRHLESRAPADVRLSDGRWYRISEHATGSGGVVKVLMDISELKRHEQDLAESTALLQTTLESITQGVAVFDDARRCVTWNTVFPRLTAADPDALKGRALSDILGAEPLVPLDAAAEACEITVGERRLEVLVTPMPTGGSVATVTDVTEHRRHEAVLTELATGVSHRRGGDGAEDFFPDLADSLARALDVDGALIAALEGDRLVPVAAVRDGRPVEVASRPLVETAFHGLFRPASRDGGGDLLSGTMAERLEDCAMARDLEAGGTLVRVIRGGSGHPMGLVAAVHATPIEPRAGGRALLDIFAARAAAELDRQRALAALRDSEARYRHLVERAPYGILMTRGDRVRFANAAARAILCDDSPLGRSLADLLGNEPPPPVEEGAGAGIEAMEERTLRGGGRAERHLLVGRYPLAQEGGDATLVVLADITDRRSAELALQQAQKLDAVGQLAGGIAHEFNNMLTAIGGFARMAQRQVAETARVESCLAEVVKASDRAATLTAQLLDFSRQRGAEQAVVIDVVDTVRELKSFLRPVLGETVDLSIVPRVDAARVEVDPARFTQAVVNLAINGRDAIAEAGGGDGRLDIAIDVVDASRDGALRDRLPSLRGERFAVVEVTDTGTGLEAETATRIFEPFFTTKPQGKGTGLGLAMVYALATHAGGAVEVEGRPGQGACFRLYLPAVETPAEAAVAGEAAPVVDLWGTALLAEDEAPVREYLRLVLEEHGMEVVSCADGEEALDVWRSEGEGIDVLVSDMVMPGLGGLDLVRAMREDYPHLKVVLVSGYAAEAEDRLADLGEGVTFLAKPVDPDRLLAAVRAALDA